MPSTKFASLVKKKKEKYAIIAIIFGTQKEKSISWEKEILTEKEIEMKIIETKNISEIEISEYFESMKIEANISEFEKGIIILLEDKTKTKKTTSLQIYKLFEKKAAKKYYKQLICTTKEWGALHISEFYIAPNCFGYIWFPNEAGVFCQKKEFFIANSEITRQKEKAIKNIKNLITIINKKL